MSASDRYQTHDRQRPKADIPTMNWKWPKWGPLLFGIALLVGALWDVSDTTFCSGGCGNLFSLISGPLFEAFGHWGPRGTLLILGGVLIGLSLVNRTKDSIPPHDGS